MTIQPVKLHPFPKPLPQNVGRNEDMNSHLASPFPSRKGRGFQSNIATSTPHPYGRAIYHHTHIFLEQSS